MSADTVTVVTPTCNGAHLVAAALRSALAQTLPPARLIVVDDASDDAIDAALAPFLGSVTVLRNETRRGVCATRNRAIAAATSEWIAFLDQDDTWDPHYLERQLETAARHPDAALIYCDLIVLGGAREATWLELQRPAGAVSYAPQGQVFGELLTGPCFAMPSGTLVRRAAVVEVGGFDESLHAGGAEDRDLWLRLAARWPVAFTPEALATWRAHAGNASRRHKGRLANQYRVYRRARSYAPEAYRAVWPQVRRRLSAVCFELGWLHLRDGEAGAARAWFLRGARYLDRLLPKDLLYLAASLLPRGLRRRLQEGRRRIAEEA